MKSLLHRIAVEIENLWDAVKPERPPGTPFIDPYNGYSTPTALVARGRVLALVKPPDTEQPDTIWENFQTMLKLFATDEMAGQRVIVGDAHAVADEEGYFTVQSRRHGDGRIELPAHIDGQDEDTLLPVFVTDPQAAFGVISDIDDTLMQTDAWALHRNLWTTMTGNAASRHIFPDAVALLNQLHAGINPVFYVSSSPWNLHAFLSDVFDRNGLVPGPMFLRDLGISETKFIKSTHGSHKGGAIDTILKANPDLDFILIGDTGQHDPQVYHDAIDRHPGRIRRMIFRAPGPGIDAEDEKWIEAIRARGVPVHAATDYSALLDGDAID